MTFAQSMKKETASSKDYPWRTQVEAELVRVNQVIQEMTESEATLIPSIARYLINSGGKRIRPVLTLLTARMCGYEGNRHIKLAAAIEFIHTATLLHDDVVDESMLRRGQSTANEVFGNTASVLVGDFLLSRAFQLMAQDDDINVLRVLADASAVITEGEVKQLISKQDLETNEARYLDIISAKTAELFSAAAKVGAMVSSRTKEEEASLGEFGQYLGIAFQIMDDVLDYSAEQQTLGKTIGDDFREGKITLPIIMAYEAGSEEQKAFWQQAIEKSSEITLTDADLQQAIGYLEQHHIYEKVTEKASDYAKKAQDILTHFPDNADKQALSLLCEFAVTRKY